MRKHAPWDRNASLDRLVGVELEGYILLELDRGWLSAYIERFTFHYGPAEAHIEAEAPFLGEETFLRAFGVALLPHTLIKLIRLIVNAPAYLLGNQRQLIALLAHII